MLAFYYYLYNNTFTRINQHIPPIYFKKERISGDTLIRSGWVIVFSYRTYSAFRYRRRQGAGEILVFEHGIVETDVIKVYYRVSVIVIDGEVYNV